MSRNKPSVNGERIAMGGYLPQYDEFARQVYEKLVDNQLEWIKVADPNAGTLDDIQYATRSELHAYQVKWTTNNEKFKPGDFDNWVPALASSWKKLHELNPDLKVIPHLHTNKSMADKQREVIDHLGKKYTLKEFIGQFWKGGADGQSDADDGENYLEKLREKSNLSRSEFNDFRACFVLDLNHRPRSISADNRESEYSDKQNDDLIQVQRFIQERVANPNRHTKFTYHEIIDHLGWPKRLKTSFEHNLIVDQGTYQPIQETLDQLCEGLDKYTGGYLFLIGGPGSGKSTLLTRWTREVAAQVVRYYAFDFVNPSSGMNYYERGSATHLFFDLVLQLRESGLYNQEVLPYKNLVFLKQVFEDQLKALGESYSKSGRTTIILIDGLDHVPREYKNEVDSFLRQLPLPAVLPDGVFIVLGSQSYELNHIPEEIKQSYKEGSRTIQMSPFRKQEVANYIERLKPSVSINQEQKERLFEKSQGHPLYLSYLLSKIDKDATVDEVLERIPNFDGDIENYYRKIWTPIEQKDQLVQLLALMARVYGNIEKDFVKEWDFERGTWQLFRRNVAALLVDWGNAWSFFHNSFRQFLIQQTAIEPIHDKFDEQLDRKYHKQLASLYSDSKVEQPSKQNQHLFQAEAYEDFLRVATPRQFTKDLLSFRPIADVERDAKLGVELARKRRDVHLLARYLLVLAELDIRSYHADSFSFTENLLSIGKYRELNASLWTGNTLHCSGAYAFQVILLFLRNGQHSDAKHLYRLAYPSAVKETTIVIEYESWGGWEENLKLIKAWISVAPYFERMESLLQKIDILSFTKHQHHQPEEKVEDLRQKLLYRLGSTLIEQRKWEDLNKVLIEVDRNIEMGRAVLFALFRLAINECLESRKHEEAKKYLSNLLDYFGRAQADNTEKIHIAQLIWTVSKDVKKTTEWLEGAKRPSLVEGGEWNFSDTLDEFEPLIFWSRLRYRCQLEKRLFDTPVPSKRSESVWLLMAFEDNLYEIAKMSEEVVAWDTLLPHIEQLVGFYDLEVSIKNFYKVSIDQLKVAYFELLVDAIASKSTEYRDRIGDYFLDEFQQHPKKWEVNVRRAVLETLFWYKFDREKIVQGLIEVEEGMLNLDEQSISERIEACLDQSSAWIRLEEQAKAEHMLRSAIQETFGVSYRKEYQFSTWIKWLGRINETSPEQAPERITWVTAQLDHLRKTTEGRAHRYACTELLQVAYAHSLDGGRQLAEWLLERGWIDYKEALAHFIRAYASRVQTQAELQIIVLLHNDLYLKLANEFSYHPLETLLEAGNRICEDKFLERYGQSILNALRTCVPYRYRNDLLQTFYDFFAARKEEVKAFLQEDDLLLQDDENYSNSLNLTGERTDEEISVLQRNKGGDQLTEQEVIALIKSGRRLEDLLRREDTKKFSFYWSKVVEQVAPQLTLSELEDWYNAFERGPRLYDAYVYIELSKCALKLENKEKATQYANKAIELSQSRGWIRDYDRGTRIDAFHVLKNANPDQAHTKAFDIFVRDAVDTTSRLAYAEVLHDVVPLLVKEHDAARLWEEVFDYLKRLFSNSTPTEELPTISSEKRPIDQVLVDYLLYLSNTPVVWIETACLASLADVVEHSSYALDKLSSDETEEYPTIRTIGMLMMRGSTKIKALLPNIKTLALSNNYEVRAWARRMLIELEEPVPIPSHKSLPFFTRWLVVPHNLTPTVSYKELFRPHYEMVELLAQWSEIPIENLHHRVEQHMKKVGDAEEWTELYRLREDSHLRAIGLPYQYVKHRVVAAWRAIMHLICDLMDTGVFSQEYLTEPDVSPYFRWHDWSAGRINEVPRPPHTRPIDIEDREHEVTEWLNGVGKYAQQPPSTIALNDDLRIIAEHRMEEYSSIGSTSLLEICQNQLTAVDGWNADRHCFFDKALNEWTRAYYNLTTAGDHLVVSRHHRFLESGMETLWLAINPMVAKSLGWQPHPARLFGWLDAHGKIAVESIYWADGKVMRSSGHRLKVGEGWMVVVREAAFQQLLDLHPQWSCQEQIIRQVGDDYEKAEVKKRSTRYPNNE